ncbi:calcium channel protein [Stygiomarasmius scandens]|uniref:Calcium channel protein n=1 Tax=Marasmiellus scandens TaxID=2682957 RepID=A0ABR1IL81_9AGAR
MQDYWCPVSQRLSPSFLFSPCKGWRAGIVQFCGGHVNASTIQESNYIAWNGLPSDGEAKGYICPLGQICRETDNPKDGIQSFDSIWAASANRWAPPMYEMIDFEFFVLSLFFIICVVDLNFWLINLFMVIITDTLSAIRSETKESAFGAVPLPSLLADEQDDGWSFVNPSKPTAQRNIFKILYDHS